MQVCFCFVYVQLLLFANCNVSLQVDVLRVILSCWPQIMGFFRRYDYIQASLQIPQCLFIKWTNPRFGSKFRVMVTDRSACSSGKYRVVLGPADSYLIMFLSRKSSTDPSIPQPFEKRQMMHYVFFFYVRVPQWLICEIVWCYFL